MDCNYLAHLLFPDITATPEDMELRFPPRKLPEGAMVTRLAPSPTGFIHFGNLFPSRISERLAHRSGGIFYLRIEDTDAKREVEGAEERIIKDLAEFGIVFDEGAVPGGDNGRYGPYRQSERRVIYQTFAKKLVAEGKAYPCFCTEDELAAIRAEQEDQKLDFGYYGKWAKYRDADLETVRRGLDKYGSFVLRFRSPGVMGHKFKCRDLIKGELELSENFIDHVLLKSDGIPTYHFAHAVDDHLMRTTHVVRGEDWLPSLPLHVQLFDALGFERVEYLHNAQLLKIEGSSKKKLSKRDMGFDLTYYRENGYAPACVTEYVMTLLNSNYEEWRTQNPDISYAEFPFSIKNMSRSGCLFDLVKLYDVCKNTVARMDAGEVYDQVLAWSREYDSSFADVLARDPDYARSVLSIGRGGAKPRKDFALWSEIRKYIGYFWDDYYSCPIYPDKYKTPAFAASIPPILEEYIEIFDHDECSLDDGGSAWFGRIKQLAARHGYAADMKEYKRDPGKFTGSVADVSMFLRLAVTGSENSPDLREVMRLLGRDTITRRLSGCIY